MLREAADMVKKDEKGGEAEEVKTYQSPMGSPFSA